MVFVLTQITANIITGNVSLLFYLKHKNNKSKAKIFKIHLVIESSNVKLICAKFIRQKKASIGIQTIQNEIVTNRTANCRNSKHKYLCSVSCYRKTRQRQTKYETTKKSIFFAYSPPF